MIRLESGYGRLESGIVESHGPKNIPTSSSPSARDMSLVVTAPLSIQKTASAQGGLISWQEAFL